jgi:hypothetical protein
MEFFLIFVFLKRYLGMIIKRMGMSRECGKHGTDEIFVQYCDQESLRKESTLEAWEPMGG